MDSQREPLVSSISVSPVLSMKLSLILLVSFTRLLSSVHQSVSVGEAAKLFVQESNNWLLGSASTKAEDDTLRNLCYPRNKGGIGNHSA